jgi:beta-galactosidase/beta-glucuronidase
MIRIFIQTFSILFLVTSCSEKPFVSQRQIIPLNGSWQFALDTADTGITEKWYARLLTDSVKLPGTLDENNKGIPNHNWKETMRLSREMMYAGIAWYRKDIVIPESWKGQAIRLMMERTKPTYVWVDNVLFGSNNNILTPQYYDLSAVLTPGKHSLTILVNNGVGSVPNGVTGSHAWTEHTQSNFQSYTY